MLHLVEHFYSIQGEGRYAGVPSLFFRFGGCNMRCEGFGCVQTSQNGVDILGCDTVYAVNREHFASKWIPITKPEQLLHVMELYELPDGVDVVLTGGEPLLSYDDPIFVAFITELIENNHRITFETNATINIDFERYPIYKKCVYALSVKLSNSGESLSKRIRPDAIFSYAQNAKEAFFKFSIDEASIDLGLDDEIDEIISYAPRLQVYCMPLGGSKKEIEKNCKPLIEFCKIKGYTYSDRLHIRIWDQNHGV
jgi:organic radical activating enzyme